MLSTQYWSIRRKISVARKGRRIYARYFKTSNIAFVHIPKCAGTSVSHALFGNDPWHYTAQEYARAEPKHWHDAFTFSIVRDPVTRFESSYSYAKQDVSKYPASSLRFVLKYRDINEFVQRLGAQAIVQHPFFWEQSRYLYDESQNLLVDYVGRFERLQEDCATAMGMAGRIVTLPHLNKSQRGGRVCDRLSARCIEVVRRTYERDFRNFGYE